MLYFCIVLPVNYGPQGKRFEGRTPVYIYTLVTVLLEAATSLGLGAQWVSAVASPYVQTLIKILLHIPKELEIYHMMAVGYPDMVPPPKLVRAGDELVHYDYYDKARLRTERQIAEFIATCRT